MMISWSIIIFSGIYIIRRKIMCSSHLIKFNEADISARQLSLKCWGSMTLIQVSFSRAIELLHMLNLR